MSEEDCDGRVVSRGWKTLVLMIFSIIICARSCTYINRYLHVKDDNCAEEIIERVLEKKLGLPKDSLDFTA